ncbi:hypothetical protein QNE38_003325 [Vibrio fluvialis]|nr:hypothetical protein [Vibrio fluvialis]ELX7504052.1 hypothetical protein [Vibrio fluvialis]
MGIVLENSTAFPAEQKILLDTNVLYWLTYANSRVFPGTLKPQAYQLQEYPKLFQKLIEHDNELFFSNYSVSELASIITKVEASMSGKGRDYERKKWLREEKGREIVLKELSVAIQTIESWAKPLASQPPLSTDEYLTKFAKVHLDGYDINIENEITKNEVNYVLTDDIDFVSVDNLKVITANKSHPKKLVIN